MVLLALVSTKLFHVAYHHYTIIISALALARFPMNEQRVVFHRSIPTKKKPPELHHLFKGLVVEVLLCLFVAQLCNSRLTSSTLAFRINREALIIVFDLTFCWNPPLLLGT